MKSKFLLSLAATLLASTSAMAANLVVATQNLPAYVDPGKDHSNSGSQVQVNAFDPLIQKDYSQPTPTFKPGLATKWEQTSPTEMVVTLRDDVKFHDGTTMTADDVVFTFHRIIDEVTPEFGSIKKQFFSNFEKVEAIDAKTVRFTTFKPEPLFETLLNAQQGYIIPKAYVMGLTGDPQVAELSDFEAFGLKPVGTGPYRITAFQPGETVVYEKFAEHYGEAAPLERVELRRIAEMATRLTALANGEVDIITNVPPDQLATIESNPALKVEGNVTPLFHLVFFNTENPRLADKKLRQALSHAIDRDLLNEALWLGKAVVPSTHTYPQYGALYMPELKTFEYDLEKAKALIAESNYDGKPIRFDTDAVYYTNGLLAAQAIKEMWGAIGVELNLNVDPKWTGNDADMETRNWSNPMYFADPAGSYGTMWSPTGARITAGSWKPSEEYSAMWERFRYSTDVEERKAAYAEIMAYVKEEAPFVLLYQPYESYGLSKNVEWKPLPGHIPYVLDFRAGAITVNK
ncbi:ABC transporter substrate-binding protein [Mycoplana dimorpha]|uniref:Peptide/nickel transport system substrate-binding protein n=1 Tax=Mycoplana dimorpha TaxID=28320 RepID=A0A2T5B3H5_MYCDI|nr:ABC transporter substrate-binding protein [Mycoplana dimorpha]PTM93536.1 peptide/nickel transport system substrate-binding protein [Mycoplana dimorpha]